MSTHASYTIDGHTFYLHHDGYPEGAARYFADAAMYPHSGASRSPNAGFADDFHRANPRAELVRPGQRVADVEYHYDVQTIPGDWQTPRKVHVMAYKRRGHVPAFGDKWECFHAGSLEDFLLAYAHCEEVELAGA